MAKKKKFKIKLTPVSEFLSPEFEKLGDANLYLNTMMESYKRQGYYSTMRLEHIPFEDLRGEVIPA